MKDQLTWPQNCFYTKLLRTRCVKAEILLLTTLIQSKKGCELEVVVFSSLSRGSKLEGVKKQGLESNLFKRKENFIYLGLLICSYGICA